MTGQQQDNDEIRNILTAEVLCEFETVVILMVKNPSIYLISLKDGVH